MTLSHSLLPQMTLRLLMLIILVMALLMALVGMGAADANRCNFLTLTRLWEYFPDPGCAG
ncbi:MAG: ATP-binding/permease protein CydD [Sodalis sp.]|nr:MAG: ATP-binding/permease protein CydD [Sodalis sp.]